MIKLWNTRFLIGRVKSMWHVIVQVIFVCFSYVFVHVCVILRICRIDIVSCQNLNSSVCAETEESDQFDIVVYNPCMYDALTRKYIRHSAIDSSGVCRFASKLY